MAEYIEREALLNRMEKRLADLRTEYGSYDHFTDGFEEGCVAVEDAEVVDVVEVVRCKDCKSGEVDNPDFPEQHYCHLGCGWNHANFYCGYGERKEQ